MQCGCHGEALGTQEPRRGGGGGVGEEEWDGRKGLGKREKTNQRQRSRGYCCAAVLLMTTVWVMVEGSVLFEGQLFLISE
jgi:hypothetical protein